jgi:hypothetical protein
LADHTGPLFSPYFEACTCQSLAHESRLMICTCPLCLQVLNQLKIGGNQDLGSIRSDANSVSKAASTYVFQTLDINTLPIGRLKEHRHIDQKTGLIQYNY